MEATRSRREQYSDATRAALIVAATRRFAEVGFAKTALEDIAADINATRGAVYHHFSNKRALFRAVFEELELAAVADVVEIAAARDDAWDAAMAALDAFLDQCMVPAYSRIVWREGPIALGWAEWNEAEKTYAYGVIERLLTMLVADGHIASVPLETATRIVFTVLGSAGTALAEAEPADKQRVRDEYRGMIRRMLTGLK